MSRHLCARLPKLRRTSREKATPEKLGTPKTFSQRVRALLSAAVFLKDAAPKQLTSAIRSK